MPIAKHTVIGTLWLYADYQELLNFDIYHWNMKQSDTTLLYTPSISKFVCSPTEVDLYRKINLDHTPQSPETQQALNELCEEYKNIFWQHQGVISHTKLLKMDISCPIEPPHIAIETYFMGPWRN